MSKLKTGLGRGLEALIRSNQTEHADINLQESKLEGIAKISMKNISPNPFQPRTNFDPLANEELKKSILTNGLIQPITVRRVDGNKYQIVSGERRWRACTDIGYSEIPAYIIEVNSDEMMLALALIENIQREHLNPIEVGLAYQRLMTECNLTQDEIAEKVGKDRSTISNSIRLLKLPEQIQQSMITNEVSMGHARALINLPTLKMQLFVFEKIKKEQLSVRKVEMIVKDLINGVKKKTAVDISQRTSFKVSNYSGIEDRLRNIFGTKVLCKHKNDGSGEIVVEYYSKEELERILELIDLIEQNYH